MPKVIDRDAYRIELATKAIDIFTEHGYNGLGMRGIAEALGVSKSALYHYFPSKKDLFEASTEIVTQKHSLYGTEDEQSIPTSKADALHAIISTLDSRFQGEMVLLLEYIKNRDPQDIADDKLLQKADSRFMDELATIVGNEQSEQAYALVMGGLLLRLLNGQQTSIDVISDWIKNMAKTDLAP
ncbi:TetR/AcrR family transcriptional regulator [Pseudoalteromonas obscura]|uniref:TetR/AcrR family transcriptional regulator n=1 Tax=Pseudoalteromonas obscura TaxID=3048491 RepID=A0ABT7EKU5_9GAMM|nr:TetR/AcrR family transcriptional regulator [Pseudoalteromonas sp. P94(2023)]MDK2595641.1 TetR/AcrR family transcriptional regulator [Pseudoalteromonas sp. P94(2023)]